MDAIISTMILTLDDRVLHFVKSVIDIYTSVMLGLAENTGVGTTQCGVINTYFTHWHILVKFTILSNA